MKTLTLQLPDGSPAPATDFGNVPPGTTTPARELRLVNTGDEAITGGIQMRVVQDDGVDGVYLVTANGVSLTDEWATVQAADLVPGAFILIEEAWQTPAGVTQSGLDNGWFDWQYLR